MEIRAWISATKLGLTCWSLLLLHSSAYATLIAGEVSYEYLVAGGTVTGSATSILEDTTGEFSGQVVYTTPPPINPLLHAMLPHWMLLHGISPNGTPQSTPVRLSNNQLSATAIFDFGAAGNVTLQSTLSGSDTELTAQLTADFTSVDQSLFPPSTMSFELFSDEIQTGMGPGLIRGSGNHFLRVSGTDLPFSAVYYYALDGNPTATLTEARRVRFGSSFSQVDSVSFEFSGSTIPEPPLVMIFALGLVVLTFTSRQLPAGARRVLGPSRSPGRLDPGAGRRRP